MSDGLKTGLVLGGVGLVGFIAWRHFQATPAGAGSALTVPGTGSALAAAPGAVASATASAIAAAPAATSSSSASSLAKKVIGIGIAAPVLAPVYATKAVVSVAKSAASDAWGALKSINPF